jgi:hypothetical protein
MLNIVFYTSGTTGSGRIIKGISIGNALLRKDIDFEYTIVSSCSFDFLVDNFNFKHIEIPIENEELLTGNLYRQSLLFRTLQDLDPDILIVDLEWFTIDRFIDEFSFKKIFLCTNLNIEEKANLYFNIPLSTGVLHFDPAKYDLMVKAEPTYTAIPMVNINPLIMRNKEEILSREDASALLGLKPENKNCLFAINGKPGEYEDIVKTYSYLEDEGYQIVYTTNYKGGIFPVVDYFNAFDLIISGGGYNSFWEAQYFEKEALFIPVPRLFEDQWKRIDECTGKTFRENGADQLVDIILNL